MACTPKIVKPDALSISESLGLSKEEFLEMSVKAIELATSNSDSFVEGLVKMIEIFGKDCNRVVFAAFVYGQAYHGIIQLMGPASPHPKVVFMLPWDTQRGEGHN